MTDIPRILVCHGTRPEWLKLRPVANALGKWGAVVREWCSGQSKDLVEASDPRMKTDGSLDSLIASVLDWFPTQFDEVDCVVVQGDTATAFACALAAYLQEIPVAHVEAGLRTYADEPRPEEAFRGMIARLATWHFAPDEDAAENICREMNRADTPHFHNAIPPIWGNEFCREANVWVVGNPIIDTLGKQPFRVLATLHRRENWGRRIAEAIRVLDEFNRQDGVEVYIVRHPNWEAHLDPAEMPDLYFRAIDPVKHDALVDRIRSADCVVTDSGGLQEEAAYVGTPCIVVRTATERTALVRNGAVRLVDPDKPDVLHRLLVEQRERRTAYGTGDSGDTIAKILVSELRERKAAA